MRSKMNIDKIDTESFKAQSVAVLLLSQSFAFVTTFVQLEKKNYTKNY